MANKKAPKVIVATPAAGTPASDGADDLGILNPHRSAEIAGRQVTAREYGFIQGLELAPLYTPFVDDLYAQCDPNGEPPDLQQVIAILGKHHKAVEQLIAASADVEVEWIRGLDDFMGMRLLYMWYGANAHFFTRRVYDRRSGEIAVKAARAALAGETPTQS